MSTTLSIACETCKERLWIGQRDYIYLVERETMEMLEKFLLRHQTSEYRTEKHVHNLIFVNEHYEPFYDGTWKNYHDVWKQGQQR